MKTEYKCCAKLPGWMLKKCNKAAKFEVLGKHYCGIHNPKKGKTKAQTEAAIRGAMRQESIQLATLAPELLESLRRLSEQCERLRMPGQPMSDAEKTAIALIKKVEGGAV